ncbi:MAG: exodeoxyribonuclease VII large subunit [candidate division Zixibacteria bacterium]|nr:exodeoxyribonuclease VII large subunit [candidate division Zixibacteria bacterium]MDH3938539.1 exodeoxyribonuclease VII large subunit [candidate division Zixibacteria bacterium]MDH4035174.1 exodeoxyribonuclease VII large subunit [candidate division Zixibacteria bacterium]
MTTTATQAYTVSAITRRIKEALESTMQGVWVEGEVSNYIHHSSGHRYLNLKDERATIKLTIWRSVGGYLKFEPENGQKVLAFGDVTVYEKGGNYQLNCRKLVPVGVGELELAFRQLHEKLEAEGLFTAERKQELPPFPQKIGVVTSPTGAAIRDIIQIARRRNNSVELIIYPAQVQGDGAEKTIAAGIEYFNSRQDIDIVITGRGGGSLEDLWPFNTELTVRAIAASKIPVISAVGHEVDTTLADLVADLRAPTPSAAAELAVWSKREMAERLDAYSRSQASQLEQMVSLARRELSSLLARPVFARPLDLIAQRQQYLDSLSRALQTAGKNSFEKSSNRLSLSLARLETLSPLNILARGYAVSRRLPKGSLIRSVKDVLPGDRMETVLADGRIKSFVEETKSDSADDR